MVLTCEVVARELVAVEALNVRHGVDECCPSRSGVRYSIITVVTS